MEFDLCNGKSLLKRETRARANRKGKEPLPNDKQNRIARTGPTLSCLLVIKDNDHPNPSYDSGNFRLYWI